MMRINRRRPRADIAEDASVTDEEFRSIVMASVNRGSAAARKRIAQVRKRIAAEKRQARVNKRWHKFAAERLKEMPKNVKYSHEYSEQISHSLTPADKVVIRYLLKKNFQQKRIAALFDVNQGRIAEVHKAMERGDNS
jgi:hypothetical protein